MRAVKFCAENQESYAQTGRQGQQGRFVLIVSVSSGKYFVQKATKSGSFWPIPDWVI